MQKRLSHNKIPSEVIHSNNYYIMPKSLRNSQTQGQQNHEQRASSLQGIEDQTDLYLPDFPTNTPSQHRTCSSNIELQQALHYSEFNYQQIHRSYQQLYQNNIDLQIMYKQSEQECKQLQNEIKILQNRIQVKENELKQSNENNTKYITEIAELKIQIQKLNSSIQKLNEESQNQKSFLNLSTNQDKSMPSKRDLNLQEEINNSGFALISSSRVKTQPNMQNQSQFDQISNYQSQIKQYQKEITEKNQLISCLQKRVKSLTDFQRQLMSSSPKKSFLRESKVSEMGSPQQTPIALQKATNESQMLSNRNLLNIIEDQKQKQDFAIHITRQSDDFDAGPSMRSTITNTKTKQELKQIYKKISQSTIYTAGLYSSLLDYQFLANNQNKLLSYSCSKDNLNN